MREPYHGKRKVETCRCMTVVATGVLGLLVGFWSGQEYPVENGRNRRDRATDREERKNTASQATGEGRLRHYRQPGERRDPYSAWILCRTAEETADARNWLYQHSCQRMEEVYAPTAGKVLKLYPMGNRIRFRTDSGLELLLNICQRQGRTAQRLLSLQCPAKRDRAQRKTARWNLIRRAWQGKAWIRR